MIEQYNDFMTSKTYSSTAAQGSERGYTPFMYVIT